jgi:hypothetical protein
LLLVALLDSKPSTKILRGGFLKSHFTCRRPDSGTINGKGRFDPDTMPANSDTLYTLKVKRGKRYRLRVINGSAISSFRVNIPNHKLTIIAADGVSTKPYHVDAFDILAGQRIDAVVSVYLDCSPRSDIDYEVWISRWRQTKSPTRTGSTLP